MGHNQSRFTLTLMSGKRKFSPSQLEYLMRPALLFLLTVLLVSSAQAITWTKRVYDVPGQGIERADFTGDGYPDLLIYDAAHITILPNLGTNQGKFNPGSAFTLNMGI